MGNDPNNEMIFIWGLAIFGVYALGKKFLKPIELAFENPFLQMVILISMGSLIVLGSYFALVRIEQIIAERKLEAKILGDENGAVYCGSTIENEEVFIKTRQRAMHTQVIGTTNAGKTESVILPWAIQDIEAGRGLLLIDGKADRSLLDKLWAYTVKAGRQKDFRLFSLSSLENSHQFNPLIGGTSEETTERVFNAFEFENPHYRSLQYEIFAQVMRIFRAANVTPTFQRLHQAISDPQYLKVVAKNSTLTEHKDWVQNFASLPMNERLTRTSGLTTALSHFAFGETSQLFNSEMPEITLEKALNENLIVYFQLPVLLSPFLGKATGKMILQSLQSSVANRHRSQKGNPNFFSVFLDDFSEYLYPGFVTILNKSRSANVGIVFAHQALGDIKVLGDAVANSILTNANLKVFMRGNDPESAEYFSSVIGTVKAMKSTERAKKGFLKTETTGDQSLREVDEFIIHPNKFKKDLGIGEGIMIVPHERGSKTVHVKFRKWDDLTPVPFVPAIKTVAEPLSLARPSEKLKLQSQKENT